MLLHAWRGDEERDPRRGGCAYRRMCRTAPAAIVQVTHWALVLDLGAVATCRCAVGDLVVTEAPALLGIVLPDSVEAEVRIYLRAPTGMSVAMGCGRFAGQAHGELQTMESGQL